MKEEFNVFGFCDGMSCGQLGLNKAKVHYDNYFAAEINKDAIKVTQHHFPKTIQLGDVTKITKNQLPKIDLFIGGSPCQSFSSAGDGTGFEGKSGLFYEYVRLLNELQPKYFFFENVRMKKEWLTIISKQLGVDPIVVNSNSVSAQNRPRIYLTNIPNFEPIVDRKIYLEDIIEKYVSEKYWLKQKNVDLLLKKININNAPELCCIDVYNRKCKLDRKCPTLTLPNHNSIRVLQDGRIRKLTEIECERLQNVPDDFTNVGLSYSSRVSMLANGWTIDVIEHFFKNLNK
jgi:DNA-cytosine methyltransferase